MDQNSILDLINSNVYGIWYLVGAALVFFMQCGFAMVEAGFTRAKNAGNIIMKNLMDFCLGTVVFILIGFGLLCGEDVAGIIGKPGFDIFSDYANFDWSSFVFNLVFCATAATIVSGAMAERTKFISYCIYSAVISAVIYPIETHWVWGGGFLQEMGAIDFAGGTVVHINAGVAALVMALCVGKRDDYRAGHPVTPHNITFVFMGMSFLWLGWFGFNAGSALAADGLAAHAFVTTAVSSAAAMLSWMFCDVVVNKKPTFVGACTGMVAGLVGITPGAGFVPVWAALIIGLTTSPICFFMISWVKEKFGYDDALDAFGCHGVGGIWGGICTGLFCKVSINDIGQGNGLFFGDIHLFLAQLASIGITIVVSVAGTLICYGITRLVTGKIRVTEREERVGLDRSQHGESAYPSFNGLD